MGQNMLVMKKVVIFLLPFVFCLSAWAEGVDFDLSWGVGDMAAYYNSSTYGIDVCFSLGQVNLLFDRKICLGFNLFNVGNFSNGKTISFAFLPMRAEYRMVNVGDVLGISLYGKMAWQFTQSRKDFNIFAPAPDNRFAGSAGLEFFLRLPLGPHYEGIIAVFAEYGITDGLAAGLRVDLLSLLALFIL
jgi:hypothetical protein